MRFLATIACAPEEPLEGIVQYKKQTPRQRKELAWKRKRNHLVCQILDANPTMLRAEGLRRANRKMRGE